MGSDWIELAVVACGVIAGVILSAMLAAALARRRADLASILAISVAIGLPVSGAAGILAGWLDWYVVDLWQQRQIARSRVVRKEELPDCTVYDLVWPPSRAGDDWNARAVRHRFEVDAHAVGGLGVAGAVMAALGSTLVTRRYRRRARLGLCMRCGYDLRASTGRCPECGTGFEDSE